jgi:hypothetical protein
MHSYRRENFLVGLCQIYACLAGRKVDCRVKDVNHSSLASPLDHLQAICIKIFKVQMTMSIYQQLF